jgi:hypothetical protein
MEKTTIYAFLSGLFLGRWTSFTSNVIITGVVVYFTEPNFYTYTNFQNIKQSALSLVKAF